MKTIHGNKNILFQKGHLKTFSPYTVSQYLDLKNNSNTVLIGMFDWMFTVYNQIDRQNVFLVT